MRRIWLSKSGAAMAIALVLSAILFACGSETVVEVTREVEVIREVEKEVIKEVEVEKQVEVTVQVEKQVEVAVEVTREVQVVVTATAEAYGAGAGAQVEAAATAVVEIPATQTGKLVWVAPNIGAGWFTSSPYDDYTSDQYGRRRSHLCRPGTDSATRNV